MMAREKINSIAAIFREEKLEYAGKEAEAIVSYVLGRDMVSIIRDAPDLDLESEKRIDNCVMRRLKGEPLQYIMGFVDFLGQTFKVGRGVLIPRPETELLVLEAIQLFDKSLAKKKYGKGGTGIENERDILDLCTGSGCIGITLGTRFPNARIIATDASEEALCYARENACMSEIHNITFLKGNFFEPIGNGQFDLIVSNPPYIRSGDLGSLQKEIRDWEPVMALDGGPDGLDAYREIISRLGIHMRNDGLCLLEIGYDQADEVRSIAEENKMDIYFRKDMAGYDRIAVLHKSR